MYVYVHVHNYRHGGNRHGRDRWERRRHGRMGEAKTWQGGRGEDMAETQPSKDYERQVHSMRDADISTLYVDFQHVKELDEGLADSIQSEYIRLEPFLREGVKLFVKNLDPEYAKDPENEDKHFFVAFFNMTNVEKVDMFLWWFPQ